MPSSFFINPRSNPEVQSLYQITRLPPFQTPLQDYFYEVVAILAESFPIGYAALVLQDPQKDYFSVEGLYGMGRETHPHGCSGRRGIIGKVSETRQPMVVMDPAQEPLYENLIKETIWKEKVHSPLLCIPLMAEEEPFGVINITSLYGPREALNEDFQFLSVLSSLLSPIIKQYQIGKNEPLAKSGKSRAKSNVLEEFLGDRLGELLNKVDPYVESKAKMSLLDDIVSIVEKILIKSALERVNYVQVAAAQLLGINRNTLRKKIQELKIKSR